MSKTRPGPAAKPRGGLLRELESYRDLLVLKWLGEQYAARIDHLEALTGMREAAVRTLMRRLAAAGLIRTHKILVGEPMWAIPTKAGLNANGQTFKVLSTDAMQLAHIAATNDVRLHVQGHSPETRWISERKLRSRKGKRGDVPDALAVSEGRGTAIEVELTTKAVHRVYAKLNTIHRDFDAVVYFCAPTPHRQLTALRETGRWPKLEVRELPNWEERP